MGRWFTPEECTEGPCYVPVVLGDLAWKGQFASDPNVIGHTVRINGRVRTIVGVMPPGFRFPEDADYYVPLATNDTTDSRGAHYLDAFARLAPGVTVDTVDYQILSFDAGMKYRGIFLQTEIYNRWLDSFMADGALPVTSIHDTGFYLQAAFFPVPKKLELYTATSQIFGDKGAGFDKSSEYLVGMNFYPADTRHHRLNLQLIDVNRSPVSSAFGYYVGGQTGKTFAASFSVYF